MKPTILISAMSYEGPLKYDTIDFDDVQKQSIYSLISYLLLIHW